MKKLFLCCSGCASVGVRRSNYFPPVSKTSVSEKTENPIAEKSINQKSVNQAIDSHAKNFLTDAEMKKFLEASRKGRHSIRDFCLMLVAYRHGLRVSELIDIRLKDLDLETGRLFVRRVKEVFQRISRLKAMSCERSELGSENVKIIRMQIPIIYS